MVEFFIQRQYPEGIIRTALQKVTTIPRPQTLQPNDKNSYREETSYQSVVPPVHQPGTQNHPNWSLLQSRGKLAAIFSQPSLTAYKRDTNIRDMLVRIKLHQPDTRTPVTTPCDQAKCGTSPFICTNTNVAGPKSQINVTKQFNCLTYNTVYVIHYSFGFAQIYRLWERTHEN